MADIATPSQAYLEMDARWRLIRDLLGGTEAMRANAELWLPKNEKESIGKYQARVGRSFLFPGFAHTIDTFTGKVFGDQADRPALDMSKVGGAVRPFLDDIDRARTGLPLYCRDWFHEGLANGLSYTLVDFPPQPPGRTLADERRAGVRPYWVRYAPQQVIGWRTQRIGGATKLMRVRLAETYTPEGNDDGDGDQPQVRVLEPGRYEVWRQMGEKKEWGIFEQGETSLDFVPLVPFYAKRTGYMQAVPPLMELAWKNVEHFQSASEQRNILHVARVPILFGKAFGADDEGEKASGGGNSEMTIGAEEMFFAINKDASLQWVEHTGACIQAGKDDLDTIKEEMAALGSQILMKTPGDPTATQQSLETAQADSNLLGILQGMDNAINLALQYTGAWIGTTDVGTVEINKRMTAIPDAQQQNRRSGSAAAPQ